MALQNIFDVGPCTVKLTNLTTGASVFYNAVLAKGQNSGPIHGANWIGGAEIVQITVNSDGSVQLDSVSGGGTDEYVIDLAPTATLVVDQVQVINYANDANSGNGQSAHCTTSSGTTYVDLTSTDNVHWTPNPAIFLNPPGTFISAGANEGSAS